MPCKHCGKEEVRTKGYCSTCYQRQRRNGSPEYARKGKFTICTVDGCDNRARVRGLCNKHRLRVLNHGDVNVASKIPGYGKRSSHPLYKVYHAMRQRCLNPDCKFYPNYGGRGITMCQEWQDDFWKFVEDVGERPAKGYSLDRTDNDGNYEPGNVRWADRRTQNRNRRNQVLTERLVREIKRRLEFGDKQADIARSLGVSKRNVSFVATETVWGDVTPT